MEKYRSYEVPVFVTRNEDDAAFLLAKGFVFVGLEGVGLPYAYKFAVRRGRDGVDETAKAARTGPTGVETPAFRQALETARQQLRQAVQEYDYKKKLAAPEERY